MQGEIAAEIAGSQALGKRLARWTERIEDFDGRHVARAFVLEHHTVAIFRVAQFVFAGERVRICRLLHHIEHHWDQNQGAAFQKVEWPLARVAACARAGSEVSPDGRDQHAQGCTIDPCADGAHRAQLHLRDPEVDDRGRYRQQRRHHEEPSLAAANPPP